MTRLKRFGRPERQTPGRRRRRSTKPKIHHAAGKIGQPPPTVDEPDIDLATVTIRAQTWWERLLDNRVCRWIRGLWR